MSKEYCAGDSIPINVELSDNGPVTPSAAVITISDPGGITVEDATSMTITTGKVSFTLGAAKTTLVGSYIFLIKCTLSSGNIAQYSTRRTVK